MQNGLITMSAITGKPNKEDIYEYLLTLCENGIYEAMLYPRSGCEVEYLSEEWFRVIGDFIECARELNMHLWLYDDFNWPSGDAGGRVTANEKFRLRAITTKGEKTGKISCKSRHNSSLFGEKFFPNLLLHEAVDYFIGLTHEEYYKRFGEHFGGVIKGVFTDEPSIGYACTGESIPYYDGMEMDYFSYTGRDFYSDMKENSKQFYLDAMTIISNRYNDCYISRLRNWCNQHGVLMAGHLMCDNDPFYATRHEGNFLKNLSSFTLPGIDEIESDLSSSSLLCLFGSALYARSETGAMAELFALGPVDMPYQKKRCILYLASAFGIDHYFLAISHLDLRGNNLVCDYFNNFNSDQPDFCGMRLIANEAMIAREYAKKDFVPDLYIRYPYLPCAKNITGELSIEPFRKLIAKLSYLGVQWKFILDEVPTDAPILELNDSFEFMLNGKVCKAEEIYAKLSLCPLVTDENGNCVEGIFVRRYSDGSIMVLNLFMPSGKYYVLGKELYLYEHDVKLCLNEETHQKKELCVDFKLSYQNDSLIRTMHLNKPCKAHILCSGDFTVRFAKRSDTTLLLNGKEIVANNRPTVLSRGFHNLYKISDTVSLKSGLNELFTGEDLKYLPSAILIGDFCAEVESDTICSIHLSERKHSYSIGEKIRDYGTVCLEASVYVPMGAKHLEIEGTRLYTEVYLEDKLLGKRAFTPYLYEIPACLWGKEIQLKITQKSSMGNIFGDTEYWDKNTEKSGWRGTPSTSRSCFGFDKISWVIE